MTENTSGIPETSENPEGGPPARDPGGEGVLPPTGLAPLPALTPEQVAADVALALEVRTRALDPRNYRRVMQERATDPATLARLDAILSGAPDPVTGRRIPIKPETWLAAWQDVANRGYGRPSQAIDLTSGGEALPSGVVFLPVLVPLPPEDSAGALVLDADAADRGLLPEAIEDPARAKAEAAVKLAISAGRASGQLPR